MKTRFILQFAWFYGITSMLRSIVYTIAPILEPLALLFIFTIISHGALLKFAMAGGIISIITVNSLSISGDLAMFRINFKFQDTIIATQVGPSDYLLGMTLGIILYSIPGILVYLALGLIYGIFTPFTLLITAAIGILLAISVCSMAFISSSFVKHSRNIWGTVAIFSILLTVLPPVLYPYTLLPKLLLYIFAISPSTLSAIAVQGLYGLSPFNIYAIYGLLAETLILFMVSTRYARWRDK